MNNPFDYEPSSRMVKAQASLAEKISLLCKENDDFCQEVSKGKMFGILFVDTNDGKAEQKALYAYSGQICGKFNMEGFVPSVFDYLEEDGYFKTHEREITEINKAIASLESSEELQLLKEENASNNIRVQNEIEAYKELMRAAKLERDLIRGKGLTPEAELIKESQYMKAELNRKRKSWQQKIENTELRLKIFLDNIAKKKISRQKKSDSLQRWLFRHFIFTNCNGESKSLLDIWLQDSERKQNVLSLNALPPSGSGECCEPKLLHYAYTHGMKPIEIGMFWWGDSPKGEIRHHMHFYPACNGKCKPILRYILDDASLNSDGGNKKMTLQVLHEDESIIVVNKPAGMLSVPGKGASESVYNILKKSYPDCDELMMVHRLDMDTSGVMVVAKTKEAHKALQRQFAEHSTQKNYTAILEKSFSGYGKIELKLRTDFDDRPRQMVDDVNGKEALTEYKSIGDNRIELIPHSGRTHQLRVHCAHKDGLDNPIKGDRLYGKKADRLYLHAKSLRFNHPQTGERMTFTCEPDF